ncbi:hypothetical protein PPL_08910 [Heterostelium album PN500]|uniref:PABC domain-containing protein n=1 Tax=Heterostelium pallidum (strain ATCC 26659 / Pp 5 / PN500) TaxID=670386 RepID=D3BK29_HETP5|nr:hypothetical protein PPL_08910 [Heterostelium album PN500]EFA78259.1 hypothetical protein PPL_08910 [Heterostelium album PN500]|eukprot:XP_020430384.1 hypothetical protein PPL_08910 [Heterostelium album PN500]
MTTPPSSYKGGRSSSIPMKSNNIGANQPNGSPSFYRKPRSFNPNHHNNSGAPRSRYNNTNNINSNSNNNDSTPTTPPPENALSQATTTTTANGEETTSSSSSTTTPVNITYSLHSLLEMPENDAKEIIGTEIYNIVTMKYPNQAPKITGMIMSSHELKELYEMVVNGEVHNKIEQAQSLIDSQQQQQPQQPTSIAAN